VIRPGTQRRSAIIWVLVVGNLIRATCRMVHGTLGATSAMAAGIADQVWTIEAIVRLLDSN
jgi:hypothetical protein